ncbi:MAG: flagellar M-ring protein FliF [Acidobacteriota bacterium]|nr:flagellar M-ring protein FliF [Acidobacteriota bacterium]
MAATGTQLERNPAAMPVPAGIAALWTRCKIAWAGMPPRQRTWSVVAAGMIAALLGTLLWMGMRTDWRTLYAGMDPDDARQMANTLTQAQIPYEVTANGTAIRVPATYLDKARLAASAKGVRSGRLGFELFDKPNWVGSEFDEHVNYQRALEGELEHTVGTLGDVESARVHLVLSHDSLFRDQERPAKASVVLKLRRSTLADGEADSIRNLVASSVDGLTPDHVVLVDASGNTPLGPRTQEARRLSAEQALEEKIVATLEPVTGPGNVRASVTLDYDPASSDVTEETYDPNKTAPLTVQKSEETSGVQPIPGGVPGTASNAPNTQASLPVYPKMTSSPTSSKSEASTFAVSKTLRHTMEGPGSLERMTAAIVVNDRLVSPASGKTLAKWQPRSAGELKDLTALAQAAIGFNATRGDVVTVQDMAFDGNRPQTPPALQERVLDTVQSSPLLLKYGALLAGLILVLLFAVRPALRGAMGIERMSGKKGKKGEQPEQIAAANVAQQIGPPESPAPDPNRQRAQEIFDQVSGHLKREPTQSSRLLQSWIHSD